MKPYYHLAQINIARAVAPLDDPRMADFAARIAEINGLGEGSNGFVWRDTGSPERADPLLLTNLTVWDSADALREFTYRSRHAELFRDRARWFLPMEGPHLALWWIPAGHQPSFQDAFARLEQLKEYGPTAAAFPFGRLFAGPDSPSAPETVSSWNYDGRTFTAVAKASNGDAGPETRFRYRQRDGRVWATYSGGAVKMGMLVAAMEASGALDMRYQHVNPEGAVRSGRCHTAPQLLPDGRMRLVESWQWTDGDCSAGESVVEEIAS